MKSVLAAVNNAQPVEDEWPALVPLESTNLLKLDARCLPSWAGEFASALAKSTETPPELAVGMILSACATAVSRRMRVSITQDYFEPTNIWISVALPPGNRKSAVQTAATAPLLKYEQEQALVMQAEIDAATSEYKTLEARAKIKRAQAAKEENPNEAKNLSREVAEIEANLPEIPKPLQLWTSDATPERLGAILSEQNETIAWLSSEAGIFDLIGGRYSNGVPNLDLMLKSHSGDSERVDRGSRPPVFLKSPRLTIGLSPQPEVLRGLASKPGFRGRGLLGRFLYLMPDSPLGYRILNTDPMDYHVKKRYEEGLLSMLEWQLDNDRPHIISLSPDAHAEWLAFSRIIEHEMRPGQSLEQYTDWAGKAPGAAARLACVLHGIEYAHDTPWEHKISKETMNNALEIIAVIKDHSRAVLDMMGTDSTVAAARHVWNWIERGRLTNLSKRDIFQGLKGTFPTIKQLEPALEVLIERGYIEIQEQEGHNVGRKPSPMVNIRPELVEAWI